MGGVLTMRAYGVPVPQGSKRFLGNGRMVESSQTTLRPWRLAMTDAATTGNPGREPLRGPVAVKATFTFPRPASHHVASDRGRSVKGNAPNYHVARPDADKVVRALLDSLTDAAWWSDDSQVAMLEVRKVYGLWEESGVWASAWEVAVS